MVTKSKIERLEDKTIKLTITIPQVAIKKLWDDTIEEFVKSAKIEGFRPGKAPKKIIEEKLNKDHVKEEVLKKLLPEHYSKAITEHNIRPIMNPKIHIEEIEEGKDWTFSALTCEVPEIDPGDYKKAVKDVTAKSKIVLPGKEPQKPSTDMIMKALLDSAKAPIPNILAEQEADRLLSQLLEDVKKLGLSLDQYLASTKRSADDLRSEYKTRAENDIKLEFILSKIAEAENITVDNKEIDEAINKAKSPEEKKNLEGNRYMLAAILRQQKTLDFLIGL